MLQLLSQRDPKWSNQQLGTSKLSIAQAGCTITCIAMKYGLTPDFVNNRLKEVNGYFNDNLIIWKKLEEALPGVSFKYKYAEYDNDIAKQNLPCLVEVSGALIGGSRHWVLFVGNQKMYDPWDGREKPTNTYGKPISFVVLGGEYKDAPKENEKADGCLIPNTSEWRQKYEDLVRKASEYDKFEKHGYISFTQVSEALEAKEKEIKEIKKGKTEEIKDKKFDDLKSQLPNIIKTGEILQDWGNNWLNILNGVKEKKKPVVNVVDNPEVETGTNWLLSLFGFNKGGGENK